MINFTRNAILFCLTVLMTLSVAKMAYCDDVWSQGQLIENLNKGAVREIAIVPGGIKGKYFDSYGRLEVFMVPDKTPGEYSSFSPEIIALIQKHSVQVIPEGKPGGSVLIIYGALFLQISAWIIILSGLILLVKINTKLNKILDVMSKNTAK